MDASNVGNDWSIQHDKPATVDRLGYTPYVEALAESLSGENVNTPLTVGIYGPWGTGKSSFMYLLTERLKKLGYDHCIHFEAWQFDGKDEVWKALILTIIRYLQGVQRKSETPDIDFENKVSNLITGVTKLALNKAMKSWTGGTVNFDQIVSFWTKEENDITQFLNSFRDTFAEVRDSIIEKSLVPDDNIYILIDDLDRCTPESCIEVFEAVKLFFDMQRCVFVVGVDAAIVQKGIEFKYNGNLNIRGQDYLEKLIQLPFNLPRVDEEEFKKFAEEICLGAGINNKLTTKIISLASDGNPRQVKQLANCLGLVSRVAVGLAETHNWGEEYFDANKLGILLILQVRFPFAFRWFALNPRKLTAVIALDRRKEISEELVTYLKLQHSEALSEDICNQFLRFLGQICSLTEDGFTDFADSNAEGVAEEIRRYLEVTSVLERHPGAPKDEGFTLHEKMKGQFGEPRALTDSRETDSINQDVDETDGGSEPDSKQMLADADMIEAYGQNVKQRWDRVWNTPTLGLVVTNLDNVILNCQTVRSDLTDLSNHARSLEVSELSSRARFLLSQIGTVNFKLLADRMRRLSNVLCFLGLMCLFGLYPLINNIGADAKFTLLERVDKEWVGSSSSPLGASRTESFSYLQSLEREWDIRRSDLGEISDEIGYYQAIVRELRKRPFYNIPGIEQDFLNKFTWSRSAILGLLVIGFFSAFFRVWTLRSAARQIGTQESLGINEGGPK